MENCFVEMFGHLTWLLPLGNLIGFTHDECCSLYTALCCAVMCLNKPRGGANSLSKVFYQGCKDFIFQNWFWVGPGQTV